MCIRQWLKKQFCFSLFFFFKIIFLLDFFKINEFLVINNIFRVRLKTVYLVKTENFLLKIL